MFCGLTSVFLLQWSWEVHFETSVQAPTF